MYFWVSAWNVPGKKIASSNSKLENKSIFYFLFWTANLPADVVKELPNELETGIYSGWASVENGEVYKAVLSLGWNPFFKNKEKSLVCKLQGFLSNCVAIFTWILSFYSDILNAPLIRDAIFVIYNCKWRYPKWFELTGGNRTKIWSYFSLFFHESLKRNRYCRLINDVAKKKKTKFVSFVTELNRYLMINT